MLVIESLALSSQNIKFYKIKSSLEFSGELLFIFIPSYILLAIIMHCILLMINNLFFVGMFVLCYNLTINKFIVYYQSLENNDMTISNKTAIKKELTHFFYVDGFKGFDCLMIMICHYFGMIKYSSNITCFNFITKLNESRFSTIIDEDFWLQLFFVVSGFLLSFAVVNNIKDFIRKVVKRFLRFYLPISAACLIIYLLATTIGFHNSETANIFISNLFQGCYSYNISFLDFLIDPIKTIFLGGSKFNHPYWVIRDMFYSSIIIYFINYLTKRLNINATINITIYIILMLFTGICFQVVYPGCLMGALCGTIYRDFKNIINRIPQAINNLVCALCFIMPFGLHNLIYNAIIKLLNYHTITVINYFRFISYLWGVIYFAIFIIMATNNRYIQKIFSSKLFCRLNDISFGVYSFHMPLLCSIGALIMIKFPIKKVLF